jgi:hypothetical protein
MDPDEISKISALCILKDLKFNDNLKVDLAFENLVTCHYFTSMHIKKLLQILVLIPNLIFILIFLYCISERYFLITYQNKFASLKISIF